MALEIFKLFGSIMINNDEANNSIAKTESHADSLASKFVSGVGTAAKWGAGLVTAASTAALALGTIAVKGADDYQQSLNQLQVSTGVTNKEMQELGDIVKGVYGNNFGESFDDVANSISTVRTNLWLSGQELQNASEYAIGFRDTFDVGVNESTRAAKALMDNFGVSTEEAFNMLVQGQQQGLNYSGEFIDTINEYSVQFSKLGLNVEDMFSILDSGTQAGAFNLDKVGDAVKEFSIRAIDGSKTTASGFQALGLNADEMAKKFANGGDEAKEAFNQVIKGLASIDDPVAQSTAGVNLFGTMWEDLGPQVVTSLSTANDYFDKTYESANELNKIKYNDLKSAIAGVGRKLQTSLLIPIGKTLLPTMNDLANLATTSIGQLGNAFEKGGIDGLLSELNNILPNIVNVILGNVNQLTGVGVQILDSLIGGLQQSMPLILDGASQIIYTVVSAIIALLPKIIELGIIIITSLIQGISEMLPTLIPLIIQALLDIVQILIENLPLLIEVGIQIIQGLTEGILEALPLLLEQLPVLIETLVTILIENLPTIIQAGVQILLALINGLVEALPTLIAMIPTIINTVMTILIENLPTIIQAGIQILIGIISGLIQAIPQLIAAIPQIISAIFSAFTNVSWFSIGTDILSSIGSGITNAASGLFSKVSDVISGVWSTIKSYFKLPHFTLDGSLNPVSWIDEGIPSIGVEWYVKGGILNSPTLFGMNGNNAMVGGEAGPEAVAPISVLLGYIRQAVSEENSKLSIIIEKIFNLLVMYLPQNQQIVLNNGVLVGELIDDIDRGLGDKKDMKGRGN
ncbi:MAG: hypothetical protein GX275_06045 [Clostridiales bacterium]|nr:hypothetical protein [Clostridiales bacterium]